MYILTHQEAVTYLNHVVNNMRRLGYGEKVNQKMKGFNVNAMSAQEVHDLSRDIALFCMNFYI